jgi:micrococcal nuclease
MALAVGAAGLALAPVASAQAVTGRVIRVVDGDTIHVQIRGVDTTVQLLGIEAPQTMPGGAARCGDSDASRAAGRLLPKGSVVRLDVDPTQDAHDRSGRLLAYAYRGSSVSPWTSVNYRLVAGGHARVRLSGDDPFEFATEYVCAQVTARHLHRGLWGSPCNGRAATRPR